MRKQIILIITAGFFIVSCNKDPDPVSTIVNVTYPVITLNGDPVVSTGIGTGSYTDPGATGKDDITGATTTLSPVINNVDLTTPGFYSVKYTTKNSNGFITNSTRLVLVTSVDPSVDLSGVYARVSNGQTVNVTKRGTGLYTTDNVGGVPGDPSYIYDVYFGQTTDTTIDVPTQPNALGGDLHGKNPTLQIDASDTLYSYIVIGSGYGTSVRQFSHQ